MAAQLDLSTQIMDQLLRDQSTLAKQLDTTRKTVSNLVQQFASTTQPPSGRPRFSSTDPSGSGELPPSHSAAAFPRFGGDHTSSSRTAVPKMSFPKFTGANPTIWRVNAWITFISSIYLKLSGLLLLLWIWMIMLLNGCKYINWSRA